MNTYGKSEGAAGAGVVAADWFAAREETEKLGDWTRSGTGGDRDEPAGT
jgi:hypothetical protein